MISWEQWELTHWNFLSTHCLENLSGTWSITLFFQVDLPFQILVATSKDAYRKPSTGMWEFFCQSCNGDVKVDKKKSFFVGDAAGRGKDHGKSDKEFAANCGLTFYTEEEFFLKELLGSKEKK